MRPPLGVYLHVPYCQTICGYCDFNTYTRGDRSGWADTAIAELRLTDIDRPAATVFFGGGTPTLLPPEDLLRVLREIELAPGAEVTVEANPDSVDERAMATLREGGVTRLSLGMQSGVEHVLRFLGRTHAADRPLQAAREARAAGFEHVSLDLIHGSPVETTDDWRVTLEMALSAAPDHISAYGLTVEPGTRLHAQIRRGEVAPPDEDAMAERYLLTEELLADAGLYWYEVSNWARDAAARCHHNVGYWHGGEWWGIGPGAHSGVGGRRWWNVKHPATWAAKVAAGQRPEDAGEDLDAEQRRLERLMLEVRTREGVPASDGAFQLATDGLVDIDGDRAVLTLQGRLLADLVTRRLAAA